MLLTRLGSSCSLLVCVYLVIVLMDYSTAQDDTSTSVITIDFSDSRMLFNRTIAVSAVSRLILLLPNGTEAQNLMFDGSSDSVPFNTSEPCASVCYEIYISEKDEVEFSVKLRDMTFVIKIVIDNRFGAGCKKYMWPVNATMNGADNPRMPVILTCEPVFINNTHMMNLSRVVWQTFASTDEMEEYIRNCSNHSDCRRPVNITNSDANFAVGETNLTILRPEMNQAWFIPSFDNGSCVYIAPGTYLYRWPTIRSHYEFSLEVQEQTMNYSELRCVADSFPEANITWKQNSNMINSLRYTFENITDHNNQPVFTGEVTITRVLFEDSGLFTCEAVHPASPEGAPKLDVRIRVKSRLRPLWPAIGIILVGIIVAMFIIIGHFVDKAIEKYKNDPSNPSHHKRLQSITSTMENDNPSNNALATKYDRSKALSASHEPVKRVSSARLQLLEEAQT